MDYNKLLEKARKVYAECVTGAEKRKLESVFPELAESEDEKIRIYLISTVSGRHSSYFPTADGFTREQILAWLEKHKYTEVDLDKAYKCADEVQYRCGYEDAKKEFEKQVEQKPAWSEEDKKQLERAIYMMEQLNMTKSWDDVYNWLKSLKPQPHWKPTEEQIHCFKCVIDFYKTQVNDTIVLNLLNSLYKDLKNFEL